MRRVDRVNLTHKRTHCNLKVFKRWWPCIWGLRSSGTFRYLLDCWYQKQYWTLYLQNTPGIPWLALQLLDLREGISPMQIYSVSSWFWRSSHILFIRRKVTGHSAICYEGTWRSGIALFIFKFEATWWLVISATPGSFTTLQRAPVSIAGKAGWDPGPARRLWRIENFFSLRFVLRSAQPLPSCFTDCTVPVPFIWDTDL